MNNGCLSTLTPAGEKIKSLKSTGQSLRPMIYIPSADKYQIRNQPFSRKSNTVSPGFSREFMKKGSEIKNKAGIYTLNFLRNII